MPCVQRKMRRITAISRIDLVPVHISDAWLEEIRSRQPEFKTEKMARYKEEFGIPDYDIGILTDSKSLRIYLKPPRQSATSQRRFPTG